jgi:hypothetical protein
MNPVRARSFSIEEVFRKWNWKQTCAVLRHVLSFDNGLRKNYIVRNIHHNFFQAWLLYKLVQFRRKPPLHQHFVQPRTTATVQEVTPFLMLTTHTIGCSETYVDISEKSVSDKKLSLVFTKRHAMKLCEEVWRYGSIVS